MEATQTTPRPANFVETLSPEYDRIRAQWAAHGHSYVAECEECGVSLAGAPVVELHGWYCEGCGKAKRDSESSFMSDEGERAAERRQMGLVG